MRRRWWRWSIRGVAVLALAAGLGFLARAEIQSSRLQARLLAGFAADIGFTLREGPNPAAHFPTHGPYDDRLGYTALPRYLAALTRDIYAIEQQAVLSPRLAAVMNASGFPIYREKTSGGLTLLDRKGSVLYQNRYPERSFANFDAVPRLVSDTLLFIENRELLRAESPRHNPAVEWDRFISAIAMLPIQWISPGQRSPGGSTLATQIEKYRHSPGGQTVGPVEKLRQMASASLRAYLDGEDTTEHRHQLVVDYLNSTPLTGRSGFGEVNGLGDGLWAWFGTDLGIASRVLKAKVTDARSLHLKALAYKQVLSLLLAQRRPSYYLIQDRDALNRLADSHLRLLANEGVIDIRLRDAAMALPLTFREDTPLPPPTSFVEQKAPNAIRARLLSLLGVPSLYQLDRTDLTVETTLDAETQARVIEVLGRLGDPDFAAQHGLTGERLLRPNIYDLSRIVYSVTLYERGPDANYLRVQADNLDQPMDINEGAKLDLGSTAKLRTLATYLEIITELHTRYAHLDKPMLHEVQQEASDNLTRWATGWLTTAPDRSLPTLLAAAMDRRYSAGTGESFFTGGGMHNFVNFNAQDNGSNPTVTESLRQSINLPFIRIMRDVVQYYTAEGGEDGADILRNPDHPSRAAFLERYADREGSDFLNRFYNRYRSLKPDGALELLASRSRPTPDRLAVIHRTARPKAGIGEFAEFLRKKLPAAKLDDLAISALYQRYGPERFSLNDLGYLARVHPLELWLVGYLQQHPDAKRQQVLAASADKRQESYAWLFRRNTAAQNPRIRIALEEEAFQRITAQWRKLGYPFETLIPSLATAIGSSADRPAALADLIGIIQNDGVRLPAVRIRKLHFAANTPYETLVGLGELAGEQVMHPNVAATLRTALADVVEKGTARRVWGAFTDAENNLIPIGGKTGTGDHRLDRYGAGGQLLESRAVARTATFAFYIGDRFFGSITAFVQGEDADAYRFTSALPAQLLKSIAPALQPLIDPGAVRTAAGGPPETPEQVPH